jgi:hypothetical protein
VLSRGLSLSLLTISVPRFVKQFVKHTGKTPKGNEAQGDTNKF